MPNEDKDELSLEEIDAAVEDAIEEELPEFKGSDVPQEDDENEEDNSQQDNQDDGEDDADSESESEQDNQDDPEARAEARREHEETTARERGWRPEEEYDGEGVWVDAPEFNRRTELYDKISSQNKVIKNLNKKFDNLVSHTKGVVERTREKTIAEIEERRQKAVQLGDTESFNEIDKELEEAKKIPEFTDSAESEETGESGEETGEDKPIEIPQTIKDFAEKNKSWFEKDQEMTDFMLFKVQQITNRGKGKVTLETAMAEAEEEVRKTFPSHFENPRKKKPSPVLSSSKESRKESKAKTISDLTKEQRGVWYSLKGSMTEKEFLEQLEQLEA